MGSQANSPSVWWAPEFLQSVEPHNLKLRKGSDVDPYFHLTGLMPDTQFSLYGDVTRMSCYKSCSQSRKVSSSWFAMYICRDWLFWKHPSRQISWSSYRKIHMFYQYDSHWVFYAFGELDSWNTTLAQCVTVVGFLGFGTLLLGLWLTSEFENASMGLGI